MDHEVDALRRNCCQIPTVTPSEMVDARFGVAHCVTCFGYQAFLGVHQENIDGGGFSTDRVGERVIGGGAPATRHKLPVEIAGTSCILLRFE